MVFNSEALGVRGVGGVEMGSMSELLPASDPDRLRWTKLSGSSGSVPISRLRGGCVLNCNHGSFDDSFAKGENWPRRKMWGLTRRSQKFGLAQACQTTNTDFDPSSSLHIFARVDSYPFISRFLTVYESKCQTMVVTMIQRARPYLLSLDVLRFLFQGLTFANIQLRSRRRWRA
jgi:hypothetical protein